MSPFYSSLATFILFYSYFINHYTAFLMKVVHFLTVVNVNDDVDSIADAFNKLNNKELNLNLICMSAQKMRKWKYNIRP